MAPPPSLVDLARELHELHSAVAVTPLPWHLVGWCAVARVSLRASGGFAALFRGMANALVSVGGKREQEPMPRPTPVELAKRMHSSLCEVTPSAWEESAWLQLADTLLKRAESTEVLAERLLGAVLPGGPRLH